MFHLSKQVLGIITVQMFNRLQYMLCLNQTKVIGFEFPSTVHCSMIMILDSYLTLEFQLARMSQTFHFLTAHCCHVIQLIQLRML